MELKLGDDEKKESTGSSLRLSGMENTSGGQQEKPDGGNPWDFDMPEEPIRMTSVSNTVSYDSGSRIGGGSSESIVVKISQIILFILFALNIASFAWIFTQDLSSVLVNILKFQFLYGMTGVFVIVDAILVNVLYERKILLIFVALIFNFWYPKKRGDHVGSGSAIGGLLGVFYLLSMFLLVGNVMKAGTQYGGVILLDDATRAMAVQVMDQTTDTGVSYGRIILRGCVVDDAYFEGSSVIFSGMGNIYIDGNTLVQQVGVNNVPTVLRFSKASTGKYELDYVELGDGALTSYGADSYWSALKDN